MAPAPAWRSAETENAKLETFEPCSEVRYNQPKSPRFGTRLLGKTECPQAGCVKLQFSSPALPGSLGSPALVMGTVALLLGALWAGAAVPNPSCAPSFAAPFLPQGRAAEPGRPSDVVTRICSSRTPRYGGPLVARTAGRTKQGDSTQDRTMRFVHFEPSQDRAEVLRIPILFVSSHLPRNISHIALIAMPSADLQRASPCTPVPAQQVSAVPRARSLFLPAVPAGSVPARPGPVSGGG